MSILRRVACAGAAAILSPMIAAAPAHAAHPGANGLVAFVRVVGGHSHLFTIHADGTGEQQLTFAKSSDDTAPDWSPDGTKIAFERRLPERPVPDLRDRARWWERGERHQQRH